MLRHDMRNPTGGVLMAVLGISAPEGLATMEVDDVEVMASASYAFRREAPR